MLILSFLPTWTGSQQSPEDYLSLGNNALTSDANEKAIEFYEKGIAALEDASESLITILSLETNLATAYSAIGGNYDKAMEHYQRAISAYNKNHNEIQDSNTALEAKAITSQTAFFFGMELQETDAKRAVEMYGYAVVLDPDLWAAWANLGTLNTHDRQT